MKTMSPIAALALALMLPAAGLAQDASAAAGGADDQSTATQGTTTDTTDESVAPEETTGRPLADRIKAVSRKKFLKKSRFELAPGFGISVNDAFFRNYLLQLDATYHIVESFSLELRGGWAFYGEPLDAYYYLRDEAKVLTTLVHPAFLVALSGKFTPIYGKVAFFSEWISHYDLYFAGGVGLTGMGILTSLNLDVSNFAFQPTMNVGVGVRGFINRWLVLNVEARDYIYPSVTQGLSNVQNLLMMTVGVSIFFPLDFEYEYEGYKVVS